MAYEYKSFDYNLDRGYDFDGEDEMDDEEYEASMTLPAQTN